MWKVRIYTAHMKTCESENWIQKPVRFWDSEIAETVTERIQKIWLTLLMTELCVLPVTDSVHMYRKNYEYNSPESVKWKPISRGHTVACKRMKGCFYDMLWINNSLSQLLFTLLCTGVDFLVLYFGIWLKLLILKVQHLYSVCYIIHYT